MILIVGPDLEETGLLQTLLTGKFPVKTAHSWPEALERAANHPVELAILIFEEPLHEAYDVLLGLLEFHKDIPILLIVPSHLQREVLPLKGLVDFLEKPFTPTALQSKIEQLLPDQPTGSMAVDRPSPPPTPEVPRETLHPMDPVSMDQLVMDLSHRLKNSLVTVRTFTHLLNERFNDVQFQRDFSRTVSREVEKMDSLIDQLIEFSEMPDPFIRPHDLLSLVEEAIKRATGRLKSARIDLQNNLQDQALAVQVDQEQFIYAMVHLMEALGTTPVKAGPAEILVCIQRAAILEALEILLRKKGPAIQDPSRLLALELFIAKRIVERHGGSIQWDFSMKDQTLVKIQMPLRPSAIHPFQKGAFYPGVFSSSYVERRKTQLAIPFRDRRREQRRIYSRSSFFPERRKIELAPT